MLNIALVCKYVAHMGHWPSGFSKINLLLRIIVFENNEKCLKTLFTTHTQIETKYIRYKIGSTQGFEGYISTTGSEL